MSQPTSYARQFSFTGFSASRPSDQQPGVDLDAEFNALKLTTDQVLGNLKLIQRDDGQLVNASVTLTQLAPDVLLTLGASWNVKGAWVTGTGYVVGDVVTQGGSTYVCCTPHAAGTFAADLTAVKWIAFYGAAAVANFVAKDTIANVGFFTRANITVNADGLVTSASSGTVGAGVPYGHWATRQNVGVDSGEALSVTGTLTSTRLINTTVLNTISGAALAANKITLPAGTFRISALAAARSGGQGSHRIGVYDFTNSAQLLIGPPNNLQGNCNSTAQVAGVVVLGAATQIQVNHQIDRTAVGGVAMGTSGALKEEYVTIVVEQLG